MLIIDFMALLPGHTWQNHILYKFGLADDQPAII